MEVGKRVAVEGPIASEPTPDTPPASVIVTRTIRNGATAARFWDEWVEDMRDLASMYPGFIGLDQMPVREGSSRRTILYTFATPDTLDTWLQSPTRAESINRLKPHLVGETVQQQITGAEALHRRSAPKWKEVVAIVAVAIPVGAGHRLGGPGRDGDDLSGGTSLVPVLPSLVTPVAFRHRPKQRFSNRSLDSRASWQQTRPGRVRV